MGNVRVKINGLNLQRLISRLVDKNILLNDVEIKNKTVKFSINESDLDALDKICKIEHKYYVVISRSGLKNFLSKLPYFLGALVAIIISTTYLFSFNKFVYNVNVSAESELPYNLTKVNQLLIEREIQSGMLKSEVSIKEIEKLILLTFEDISGCSVELDGGNLNIKIFPATVKEEINKSDIKSKYNAVITSAEAFSGTLAVKVGDIVQIGDVLINNENGASGKVEGKVYFVATQIYNENQQYAEKTGKSYKVRNLNFLNLFSVKGKNRCPFSNFIVEKCDFYVAPNYLLPLSVEEDVYYEVEMKSKTVPFEEVETEVLSAVYNEALKQIDDKDKITNVSYSVVKEGQYTRADCFIEVIISLF